MRMNTVSIISIYLEDAAFNSTGEILVYLADTALRVIESSTLIHTRNRFKQNVRTYGIRAKSDQGAKMMDFPKGKKYGIL